jgi:PAS domain S-box-containing protein
MAPGPLEQALDYAPTGIALLTGDGRVRWANRRLCRMLRRDADDLVDLDLVAIAHPDDRDPDAVRADALEVGQMRDRGRLRFLRPDGSSVWGGLTVSRLPDDPSGPVVVAHVNDLSMLMRAEEQLGMVVQGLDDGIVAYDPRGRLASANPAATHLLGIPTASLIGDAATPDWPMLDEHGEPVPPEERPEARVAATGEVQHQLLGVELDDGSTRWLDVAAHPVERSNGERWVIASYRDVSERRRVEAELALSIEADRAKSEFLSRMSHELRTPLNVVLGYAQLLQMDDLGESQRESVQQILAAGRHLLELVEEVLDLERIQHDRLDVTVEPVDLSHALREALELVQPLADASEIAVELQTPSPLQGCAIADPRRLRQVLLNLLANAIKYNRPNGRVFVTAHELGGAIVVRIRDTGRGIEPSHRSRVFQPFERLDADALGIDGAGVGLALSKRFVEAMGGQIGLDSAVGEGSTFWFALRATTADEVSRPPRGPISQEDAAELVRRASGGTRRLLYIEDNPASRRLVEQLVARRGGFELVAAGTAAEGLELARLAGTDAILLDLHLPDRPGEEVFAALRADPRTATIPVIVLTADATPARRRGLEAGVAAYLTKPVDAASLFAALETTVALPLATP